MTSVVTAASISAVQSPAAHITLGDGSCPLTGYSMAPHLPGQLARRRLDALPTRVA